MALPDGRSPRGGAGTQAGTIRPRPSTMTCARQDRRGVSRDSQVMLGVLQAAPIAAMLWIGLAGIARLVI